MSYYCFECGNNLDGIGKDFAWYGCGRCDALYAFDNINGSVKFTLINTKRERKDNIQSLQIPTKDTTTHIYPGGRPI